MDEAEAGSQGQICSKCNNPGHSYKKCTEASYFSTPTSTLLTPKFGRESDLWVQLGEESVWWKERIFSDVFGKETCGRLFAPVRQKNS
jgi:hypothetical protein